MIINKYIEKKKKKKRKRKSISENRIDWETKWLSLKGGRLRKVVAKESGSRLE